MAATLAVAVLAGAANDARGQVTDNFTCYKAKTSSGTPQFAPISGVSLVDAFRSSTVTVKKPRLLCAPTNKNGEDPAAPSNPDHLESYQIKPTVKFPPVTNVRVVDQFGELRLDLKKPVALQVPTAKSFAGTPPAPTNSAVDHFTCYKAKVTSGTPKFVRVNVTLEDQFGPMTAVVLKPRRLCLPTNKQNEEPGAENNLVQLMCYKIKQVSHPRFVMMAGLYLNNQFGPERVDAKKPAELCVLAVRNPGPTFTPISATPTLTPAATSTPTPTSMQTPAGDLLGSDGGGSDVWDDCEGQPDDTPYPLDPRSLIQPGVNDGKAVHYNTRWRNCHVDPEAVQEVGNPATCGELRERFYRGSLLLDTGSPNVGGLFTGTDPDSNSRTSTFSAELFNELWTVWGGYVARPANFDELVAERYGSAFNGTTPYVNAYPLPGEDPNLTNGGSGRLPELLTQLRDDAYGTWSGEITVTCHGCHSGFVGPAGGPGPGMTFGGGSSLADLNLLLRDLVALGWEASAAMTLNLNRTRGRNNASLVNLAFASTGIQGDPEVFAGLASSGSTADMDTPAWWNMGHRAVKFVDGVFPMDAPRIDAIFYAPSIGTTEAGKEWMRVNGPDLNAWVEAQKAPPYPFPIDTLLAEQGAVLFHTLDMWAPERNNPIPRPERPSGDGGGRAGNGSCASCHGAYAPRYVNDPAFLDTPLLEGMAAYIVPLNIIGTDPERVNANNDSVQEAGTTSFFGYPGSVEDCGPQNRPAIRGNREPGYLAPPLYGVWASPPYFHNGSVPNAWEVLQPADRQQIWRRVSKPVPLEQQGCLICSVIMGYDTDLTRAYDTQKLGWRYDPIPCEVESVTNPSVSPYVNCNPSPEDQEDPLAEQILAQFYSGVLLGWNLVSVPPLTPAQMEDRKNYNTRMFAQGNEGHEFNSVLTDQERLAIIEYLKTL